MKLVEFTPKPLDDYEVLIDDWMLDELRRTAEGLRGVRLLHVSSTALGGGVAEILQSMVPFLNQLGLAAEWKILTADEAFYRVTKRLHNGLQGAPQQLTPGDYGHYLTAVAANAKELEGEYDVAVVHDPQPAALLESGRMHADHWIWRCHLDTSAPDPEVWSFVRSLLMSYDAAIFTLAEYVPKDLPIKRVELIPPAIDPLRSKNLSLPSLLTRRTLQKYGVNPDLPLVTQVSRFDHWKDPLGVYKAYKRARQHFPDLQLALIGSSATDDPEGSEVLEAVSRATRGDDQTFVLTNLSDAEVGAFQVRSDLVLQKSLREGFGLVVAEAAWKGTAVIGSAVGGIPLQLGDEGMVVGERDDFAEAIIALLQDKGRARDIAAKVQERVRKHFLMPRLALTFLHLLTQRLRGDRKGSLARDPMCGLYLEPGSDQAFCSERCRAKFKNKEAGVALEAEGDRT
jgi:trehalose synthase